MPPNSPPTRPLPLAVAFTCLTAACHPAPPPITGSLTSEDFRSTIVGDDYRILVRRPPDFDPARRYPVLYQLDATNYGNEHATVAGWVSRREAEGLLPPTIVVGFGYPYGNDLPDGRGRWRDYVLADDFTKKPGGADTFLRALGDELLPHVEATEPVDVTRRVLSGHSLSGFFTLYALFHSVERPLFSGYLAGDPSLGHADGRLLTLAAEAERIPNGRVYLPIARYDGAVQRVWFDALVERLRARPGVDLTAEVIDDDHAGLLHRAYERGVGVLLGCAR